MANPGAKTQMPRGIRETALMSEAPSRHNGEMKGLIFSKGMAHSDLANHCGDRMQARDDRDSEFSRNIQNSDLCKNSLD